MSLNIGLERSLSFINCQLSPGSKASYLDVAAPPRRFVTISREGGCAAHVTAEKLAELLQARSPKGQAPWTVFDRNIIVKILEDHHLPQRLEKYMPEDRVSELSDIMDELFDLHPSSWTLVHKGCETVLRIAELGNCILIGRAAGIITGKLEHGLHVRLIGSLEQRVQRVMRFDQLDEKAARKRLNEEDGARRRFVKKYFSKDVNDPLLYDLIINTDHFSPEHAAQLIAEALREPVEK